MMIHETSTTAMRLNRVSISLPNEQLVLNNNARSYEREAAHLLFMPDLALWFADYNLRRAPDPIDVWRGSQYDFATERRVQNKRGYGSVGGWVKETTHVYFYFLDKPMAILFKLTWGGQ